MSYPVADVDRFSEYESNPLPVRVRGEELTVGAISQQMKTFVQAFDLLRGALSNKRSTFAQEYDLWCWLGAQLIELKKNEEKSRIVLAYWSSLYPKTRAALAPRDALDARTVALDVDTAVDDRAVDFGGRRLGFEVVYSKPMLSAAMFALDHVRKNEPVSPLLTRVPRDLYLKLAMQARPKRDPALAVRIVAHLLVEELELTRAVERDLADLVRPAAKKKLSDRDALRFQKILERLPTEWGIDRDVKRTIDIVRAFQSASDSAANVLGRALELVERIGRVIAPRLGKNDWPLPSVNVEPRATRDELSALAAWIKTVRTPTQTLALLRSACLSEVQP
jgi:hypothetical protein